MAVHAMHLQQRKQIITTMQTRKYRELQTETTTAAVTPTTTTMVMMAKQELQSHHQDKALALKGNDCNPQQHS